MLTLRFCSSSTWFASPFVLFSPPMFSSGRRKMITWFSCSEKAKTTQNRQADKRKRNEPGIPAHSFPEKENNTGTFAFQSGGSPLFPRGANYLFSSLATSLSLGLRAICRLTVFDEANDIIGLRPDNKFFEGNSGFPQIRTPVDKRTTVDSDSFHFPVRETLLSRCFKTRASR